MYGLTTAAYALVLTKRPDTTSRTPSVRIRFRRSDRPCFGATDDRQTMTLLNPFLLMVIVATGIRYGVATMYLAWLATLLALLPMFAGNSSKLTSTSLFPDVLMLALVPLFFSSLVRQIDNVSRHRSRTR